ncbi:MAG: hypothetical protein GW848_01780 [Rhodoferax sp.]|nr:hypothetical protein [Rhodoferax sp.]NCP54545.1 hypothetical protein [Rhodoferax sp.]
MTSRSARLAPTCFTVSISLNKRTQHATKKPAQAGFFVGHDPSHSPKIPSSRPSVIRDPRCVFVAVLWLWAVDGIRPSPWDLTGITVTLLCTTIIFLAPRHA